jgi:hypothetical protein
MKWYEMGTYTLIRTLPVLAYLYWANSMRFPKSSRAINAVIRKTSKTREC